VILFSSHGIVGIFRKGGGTGWLASNFTSFFLSDPMMLQLYTLCFPLIHWRHFFETTKIKLSEQTTTKTSKNTKKKRRKKTQIWRNWQTRKTSNNDQAKRLDCRPQVTTIFQQRLAFDRRRHRHRDHDHVAATTTAIVIMLFSLNEPHSGLAFFQPSQTQANTAS